MRITQIMQNSNTGNRYLVKVLAVCMAVLLIPVGVIQFAYASGAASPSASIFSVMPVEGVLSSGFGKRHDPFTKKTKFHRGVDIAAKKGTPVFAPADGRVLRVAKDTDGYGNLLEIDHGNGLITRYGQLKYIGVWEGQKVTAGQKIAKVGSTGRSTAPHLHLEVLKNEKPIDPASVIKLPAPRL